MCKLTCGLSGFCHRQLKTPGIDNEMLPHWDGVIQQGSPDSCEAQGCVGQLIWACATLTQHTAANNSNTQQQQVWQQLQSWSAQS
jgi:hypothetical protein